MEENSLLGINNRQGVPESAYGVNFIRVDKRSKEKRPLEPDPLSAPQGFDEVDDFDATSSMQQEHDDINSKRILYQMLKGFIGSRSTPPTYIPKNISQQIQIVNADDDDRLYIYDTIDKEWEFIPLLKETYDTVQLALPVNNAGDFGWDPIGVDPVVSNFANGARFTAGGDIEFGYYSDVLGPDGILSFADEKAIKYEMTVISRNSDSTNKNFFGFYGNNTDDAFTFTNLGTLQNKIGWIAQGTTLYGVTGTTSGATALTIPGITFTPGVGLRLKIIWRPGESVQFYVDGQLKAETTVNVPDSGALYALFGGLTANIGNSGFFTHFPRLSIAN